jgi:glycolate oxidase FAD binding subunit
MSESGSHPDAVERFAEAIRDAGARGGTLRFRGGGSKDFYGERLAGDVLDTRTCNGIVDYDPTELVVTARCGTPLAELEAALAERAQMLAFEPPHFAPFGDSRATAGGMVAAGLSGPRRASAGAVRDFVLGATVMDARGRVLRFGGQVMKNVAGYDLSRLMAGSLGTLALILEVSLKTLPRPVAEVTLRLEMPQERSLQALNGWSASGLPLSASAWSAGELTVRASGAVSAVTAARRIIGGEEMDGEHATSFWAALRDQSGEFFRGSGALWRISLPAVTPVAALAAIPGEQLVEWGGALRWIRTEALASVIREAAAKAGGHAALFRGGSEEQRRLAGVFHPLAPALMKIHRNLKAVFDPQGLFNPGRMYPDL